MTLVLAILDCGCCSTEIIGRDGTLSHISGTWFLMRHSLPKCADVVMDSGIRLDWAGGSIVGAPWTFPLSDQTLFMTRITANSAERSMMKGSALSRFDIAWQRGLNFTRPIIGTTGAGMQSSQRRGALSIKRSYFSSDSGHFVLTNFVLVASPHRIALGDGNFIQKRQGLVNTYRVYDTFGHRSRISGDVEKGGGGIVVINSFSKKHHSGNKKLQSSCI
ncbi:hypothetical protein DFS33DRAFT_1271199 [Desarmillaria ectypa]|nr:hypothetical protein DFS33DRAFT_1271199 [Desarmillaria ectypa]